MGAALLAALIETVGYEVRFHRSPEAPEGALRRVRPQVCLVDCTQPDLCTDEFLGRAAMQGIAVVVFGTPEALARIRKVIETHQLGTLLVPPEVHELERVLQRALTE